jgi:hypothetical protein
MRSSSRRLRDKAVIYPEEVNHVNEQDNVASDKKETKQDQDAYLATYSAPVELDLNTIFNDPEDSSRTEERVAIGDVDVEGAVVQERG